jgi:hypothetical protein
MPSPFTTFEGDESRIQSREVVPGSLQSLFIIITSGSGVKLPAYHRVLNLGRKVAMELGKLY